MAKQVSIELVSNGYIIGFPGCQEVHKSLEDVFSSLLHFYEGRTKSFIGDSYGRVDIIREYNER